MVKFTYTIYLLSLEDVYLVVSNCKAYHIETIRSYGITFLSNYKLVLCINKYEIKNVFIKIIEIFSFYVEILLS